LLELWGEWRMLGRWVGLARELGRGCEEWLCQERVALERIFWRAIHRARVFVCMDVIERVRESGTRQNSSSKQW